MRVTNIRVMAPVDFIPVTTQYAIQTEKEMSRKGSGPRSKRNDPRVNISDRQFREKRSKEGRYCIIGLNGGGGGGGGGCVCRGGIFIEDSRFPVL